MLVDRRFALKLLGALGISGGVKLVGVNAAFGQEHDWRHGLSLFGELKYPADFKHFDYVNPTAPKGGRARLYAIGTFDSLNPYTFRGQPAGLSD
jgi:microcin C transport system substrate-binding protein